MKTILLAASVALLLAGAAQAQNLVTNGDFETGHFPPWTLFGDMSYTSLETSNPHSGLYDAKLGPFMPGGGIEQTLTAPAGLPVTVDFWLRSGLIGDGDFFDVSLGGTTLFHITADTGGVWTEFSMQTTVPNDNPVLQLNCQNVPSYWYVDDVSVTPEPASFLLLALGLLLRRR